MKIPRSIAIAIGITVLVFAVGGWTIIDWTINYHWVPVGSSMQLRYKGPPLPIPGLGTRQPADDGQFAKVEAGSNFPAQLGVLQEMVGPGRHFYCPLWWECKIVPDIVIEPGSVGIVESLMGRKSPQGDYIVDGDLGSTEFSGILRKVLPPGQYRINPYAYKITLVKKEEIRIGNQLKVSGWVSRRISRLFRWRWLGTVSNQHADKQGPNTKICDRLGKHHRIFCDACQRLNFTRGNPRLSCNG